MEDHIKTQKFRWGDQVYKYGSFLGKGGFGVCYSFKNKTSDYIAVKMVDKNKIKLKSFDRESEIHKELIHENVVRYFSKCEDIGYQYIIMEMCGESLQTLFHSIKIPLIKLQKYGRDILHGLYYLQRQNIVHRDIKLENILISNNHVAKIADFGFALYIKDLEEMNNPVLCGSYFYLAPEIVKNFRYSTTSDIWSFGVIMYRLTTGNYPFFGNPEDLFYRIERIFYYQCAALNMNKNGRRLTQLFYFIFRSHDKRLSALELLNVSFFKNPLVSEEVVTKDRFNNDEIVNAMSFTKIIPGNFSTIIDMALELLTSNNVMGTYQVDEFDYLVAYLDYTINYGLMYYLSNNTCGFWFFDLSTLFRYNGKYYMYKYSGGQRYLMGNENISTSKQIRFQILLNELMSSERLGEKDNLLNFCPIFIDFWVQTVQYFIIILSNRTIHIEKYRSYRDSIYDQYVISGRTGRFYLKVLQNDEISLKLLSQHEKELFFKKNPRILEILLKYASNR